MDTDTGQMLASLPPVGGSVVPGRGSPIPDEPPDERPPRWAAYHSEETLPRNSETTVRMQSARGFIDHTGTRASQSFGRLARRVFKLHIFYRCEGQEARLQKREAIPLVSLNEAMGALRVTWGA